MEMMHRPPMEMTRAAPSDRWFAVPFLLVSFVGIPPALFMLFAGGAAAMDTYRFQERIMVTLMVAGLTTLFLCGMTLFVGYFRALSNERWAGRPRLWSATIAFNSLGLLGGLVSLNPIIAAWFTTLVTFAAFARRAALRDLREDALR
jgi:hypothetical protein